MLKKILLFATGVVATAVVVKNAETLLTEYEAKKRREYRDDQSTWDPTPKEPDRSLLC